MSLSDTQVSGRLVAHNLLVVELHVQDMTCACPGHPYNLLLWDCIKIDLCTCVGAEMKGCSVCVCVCVCALLFLHGFVIGIGRIYSTNYVHAQIDMC